MSNGSHLLDKTQNLRYEQMHNINPTNTAVSSQDDWGALSRLPGNPMMWVLIWSELVVFGVSFIGFAIAHALQPDVGAGH